MFHHCTISFPAEKESLGLLSALCGQVAGELGLDPKTRTDLDLAIEEGLLQLVHFSFGAEETGELTVLFENRGNELAVVFKDSGMPFDPGRIPDYDPRGRLLDAGADAGLSKFLLSSSVDAVLFRNLGKSGMELELLKKLPSRDIIQYDDPVGKREMESAPGGHPGQVTEIRLMREDEAIEVSRLVYRSYGHSYVYEDVYFPERIVVLHRQGLMQSAVAISGEGKIVGHFALVRPARDSRIIECGIAVVDPAWRGQGIMKRLLSFLIEHAHRSGCAGIFASAVTNHPYTQKLFETVGGFHDTALMLGYAPATMKFRQINDVLEQREAIFVSFHYMETPAGAVLYAPGRHADIIRQLYDGFGFKHEIRAEAENDEYDPDTHVTSEFKTSLNISLVTVSKAGRDFAAAARAELKRLCLERVDMIYALLDLERPSCPFSCRVLEDIGFFFAGIIPCYPFPHTLILQYANNVKTDFGKLTALSPNARLLVEYVRASRGD
jgi:serine/threonine-protein kinase RsbW